MKIFLGDLVHTWEKTSVWTMPLNIGFLATYAQKHLGSDLEVRLFKRPEIMIEAIKNEKPDVVGLSYYVWNQNLNHLVMQIAKEHLSQVLTVGGGPCITSLNATEEGARKFFTGQPEVDVYCVNQGEAPFLEALKAFNAAGSDLDELRRQTIPGVMVNNLASENKVQIGTLIDAILDLDQIPSPYLTGLLDEFFDDHIIPIIETNRSCPYRCTFCAWGIGTDKLARFSEERVLGEIDYISKRARLTANMYVADANFSILERDAKFAARMYENKLKSGYPGHVMVQWNKSRPDRVLKTIRSFGDITEIGASMQSLNPDVLDVIKRRNLPIESVAELKKSLEDEGSNTVLFSELILGLPNETSESHLYANRTLMDLGAEVFNYNLHLLPGTEMDSADSRTDYFTRTGWRLHDNAFGIYDGQTVFEGQEVVLQTSTMTMEELRSFRFIHFILQFMWGRRWYYDYLMLFKGYEIHPLDVILEVCRTFREDSGELGEVYKEFQSDHDLENFETFEELADYWRQDQNLERLRNGSYGKLNYLFTFKILLEHQSAFNVLLDAVARKLASDISTEKIFLNQIKDVLHFSETLRIGLSEDFSLTESRMASFNFDILAWKANGSKGKLDGDAAVAKFEYEFFLPENQQTMLNRQLQQFKGGDINRTLRKMSEDTSPEQFFYQVRQVNNPSYVR
jgi:radical SAM superfamily enzyme YgiQ (UPF0313 family)